MKFAVIGPQGHINRIADTEPTSVMEGATVQQITDEQAEAVVAGRTSTPRVVYVWEAGELITFAERVARRQAARPQPVPESVPLWSLRQVLMEDGLLDTILAAVQNNAVLLNFLEYGNYVNRDSPSLAALAAQLERTSDEVDNLFRRAATKKL
jgi:hypothetical protein